MTTSPEELLARADDLLRAGRRDEAVESLGQALAARPDWPPAAQRLGEIALVARDASTAERHLAVAVAGDPTLFTSVINLATLYWTSGRPRLAIPLLRDALTRKPDFPEAWFNLGNSFLRLHDYRAAIDAFERAVALRPDYANAWTNLGRACRLSLQHARALECARRGADLSPKPQALSNLVFTAMFSPDHSPERVAEFAAEWDARFAAPLRDVRTPDRPRDPDRVLNVGYVGPIFRRHAGGWLIEPLLAGHDRTRFRVFCYSDVASPDETTERIRSLDLTYRATASLDDERLAESIRRDEIDVLVDLNAHMAGVRLGAAARRPAPVRVAYLAYPFTTGVRAIDYRVSDFELDPVDAPRFGPEALLRLRTSYWIYRPDRHAPEPLEPPPAAASGVFTFASLNDSRKFNRPTLIAWSEILRRVPDSRLVLLADDATTQRSCFDESFRSVGLDPSRCELVDKVPREGHLARYRRFDLCLDPFPYGGHTTTLDSLWMGVPVLTLVGAGPYARGAASILRRVGLAELATSSLDDYVARAVALASDRDRLAATRRGLRARMAASVLCDERGFVAEFEAALRLAWTRWCDGLAPCDLSPSARPDAAPPNEPTAS